VRAAGLLLLPALSACDLAVGAAVASRASRQDGSSPSAVPASPDTQYRVWFAELPDDDAAQAQQDQMTANGGNPDPAVWSEAGAGSATADFAPSRPANAVLFQAGAARSFKVDALEVLDAGGTVVASASGTVRSGGVTSPERALGPPDGLTADTAPPADSNAFLFARQAAPIHRVRVSAWADLPGSGDVLWTARWPGSGDATPGGFDVSPGGAIAVTVSVWSGPSSREIRLVRFGPGGAFLDQTLLASPVDSAQGSHGVAADPDGRLYAAMTVSGGSLLGPQTDIRVVALHPDLTVRWSRTIASTGGSSLVSWNPVAVGGDGHPVVGGGVSDPLTGLGHWLSKFDAASGSTRWTQAVLPDDPAATRWHAVAADAAGQVFSAGDLTSSTLGKAQAFLRKTDPHGAAVWSQLAGTSQPQPDLAQAVGADAAGNAWAGGYFGSPSRGRDAALVRFTPQGVLSFASTHDGRDSLDDEILGVAVDADGAAYAVGYETLAGPNPNLWIRKFDPSGNVVWTRTYDGAGGDDRAVSVRISGSSVLVAGYETRPGAGRNVHLRSHVK